MNYLERSSMNSSLYQYNNIPNKFSSEKGSLLSLVLLTELPPSLQLVSSSSIRRELVQKYILDIPKILKPE